MELRTEELRRRIRRRLRDDGFLRINISSFFPVLVFVRWQESFRTMAAVLVFVRIRRFSGKKENFLFFVALNTVLESLLCMHAASFTATAEDAADYLLDVMASADTEFIPKEISKVGGPCISSPAVTLALAKILAAMKIRSVALRRNANRTLLDSIHF